MNLKKLTELFLSGNPLKIPSHEIVSKGIPHILRDCKERYKIELRGRVAPPMSYMRVGVMEEVYVLEPKYEENLKAKIEAARESHVRRVSCVIHFDKHPRFRSVR